MKRNGKWLSVFVHEVPLPKKAASQEISMQLKVDHAGLCAYELKPMQDAFAQLGLATEYGGAHVTGGTHNALLGFDDGSLPRANRSAISGKCQWRRCAALDFPATRSIERVFLGDGCSGHSRHCRSVAHLRLRSLQSANGSRKKPDAA